MMGLRLLRLKVVGTLRSRVASTPRLAAASWLALLVVPGVVFLVAFGEVAAGGPSIAAPVSISANCQAVQGELPNLCPSTPTNASDGTHHPELQVRADGTYRYHFDSVIWNAGGAFQIEGTDCDDEGCSTVKQRIFEDDGNPGSSSHLEDVVGGRLIVEAADGHNHYHYENATLYELIRPGVPNVPIAKIGFCMLDTFDNRRGAIPTSYYPQGSGTCSRRSGTVTMGISRGWATTTRSRSPTSGSSSPTCLQARTRCARPSIRATSSPSALRRQRVRRDPGDSGGDGHGRCDRHSPGRRGER